MSKVSDEKNEPKSNVQVNSSNISSIKPLQSMSERQLLNYVKKQTLTEENWDMQGEKEKIEEETLDFFTYFAKRKEQIRNSWSKNLQIERAKLLKSSLKEFTHIKKNVYIDRKKYTFLDDDAYICQCKKKNFKNVDNLLETLTTATDYKREDEYFSCGSQCINKYVSTECVEHLCPSGRSCRNRRFQQHLYSEVFPIKTEERGWGLCAGEFLPKGTFVMQYIGEIYSIDSVYGQQKLKEYKNKTCTYLMEISKKEVIDPSNKGNLARFINHSCEPNCETQKWHVLGEICVGIFTLRDIQEGEELTFNYGFNILKTIYQKCLCGTPTCKGYLGIVSQNDIPKGGVNSSILCDICKVGCRATEKVLVCEMCKKVSHKICAKKTKHVLCITDSSVDPAIPSSNKNKEFICSSCVKKKTHITSSSNSSNNNITKCLSNLSINLNKEKKSSQQLIKEYKNRKKIKKPDQEDRVDESQILDENSNIVSSIKPQLEESISVSESYDRATKDCDRDPFKDPYFNNFNAKFDNMNNSSASKKSLPQLQSQRIEEEFIIDYTIEVHEQDIRKIKIHLPNLCQIGARLFWDFRQVNIANVVEIKINGTPSQIEKVKEAVQKICEEKHVMSDFHSATLNIPQIFVRKIIGHQFRNLNSYRNKFNVDIEFDGSLITDDIFPIYESTKMNIKGKEAQVKAVEMDIKKTVEKLKVLTIFLMPQDYTFVKNHICHLKTIIDPGDVRLRKRDYKIDRDIKHSFYYIPCTNKDLVIIGFEDEIRKGQKVLEEFLLRQNTMEMNYSLCFLCPTYFSNLVNNFRNENANTIKNKNLLLKVYEPIFSRKHLNIYIEGKWKEITEIKSQMFKYITDNDKNASRRKNAITEFQQYTFNQEHKLISKNIRKFLMECESSNIKANPSTNNSYIIKNWDLISDEVWQHWESANFPSEKTKNNNGSVLTYGNEMNNDKNDNLLKNFMQDTNRDTSLNYLLHLPPGSYNSVFNQSKLDLTKDLIFFVEEALDSYKASKKLEESQDKDANNALEINKVDIDVQKLELPNEKKENPVNVINTHKVESQSNNYPLQHSQGNLMLVDEYQKNLQTEKKIENLNEENNKLIENLTDDESLNKKNHDKISTNNLINNTNSSNYNKQINIQSSLLNHNLSRKSNGNSNSCPVIPSNNNASKTPFISTNNFSTDIDSIKNTLLNKLNEIKNENNPKPAPIVTEKTDGTNSVKSIESLKNIPNLKQNYDYEIVVSPEDLNLLLKNNQSSNIAGQLAGQITSNSMLNSESMNISYNFSNINQMNININISSFPGNEGGEVAAEEMDRGSSKSKQESKYLRKKMRAERSLSPQNKKLHNISHNFRGKDEYRMNNSISSIMNCNNSLSLSNNLNNSNTRYYKGSSSNTRNKPFYQEKYNHVEKYTNKWNNSTNNNMQEKHRFYINKGIKFNKSRSRSRRKSDSRSLSELSRVKIRNKIPRSNSNSISRSRSVSRSLSRSHSRSRSKSLLSLSIQGKDSRQREREPKKRNNFTYDNSIGNYSKKFYHKNNSYNNNHNKVDSYFNNNHYSNYKNNFNSGRKIFNNFNSNTSGNYQNYFRNNNFRYNNMNNTINNNSNYKKSNFDNKRRFHNSINTNNKNIKSHSISYESKSPSRSYSRLNSISESKKVKSKFQEFLNLKSNENESLEVGQESNYGVIELKSSITKSYFYS